MSSKQLNDSSLFDLINTHQDYQNATAQDDIHNNQGHRQTGNSHLELIDKQEMQNNSQGFNNLATANNIQKQNLLIPGLSSPAEQKPFVCILEQPASNKLGFWYTFCDGRPVGGLQGQFSTKEKKTFPKIQILGYKGTAMVVVSCVTHDNDTPRVHPNNLVGYPMCDLYLIIVTII